MAVQTLQANVGVGEQLFLLKENGQYLPVTPTTSVPGGGAGPAPIAGVDDGGVAEAGTGGAAGTLVYRRGTTAVAGQVLTWNGTQWVAAGVRPFTATYYVDPTFTGTQTGSDANPFTTIAAAFAYAAMQGIVNGIIFLPPGAAITENVVFPSGGGSWDITGLEEFGTFSTTITGSITVTNDGSSSGGLTEFSLNQLDIEGNVAGTFTGPGAGQFILRFNQSFLNGSCIISKGAGAGKTVVEVYGIGLREAGGEDDIEGDVSADQIICNGTSINGTITFTHGASFDFSRLNGGQVNSVSAVTTQINFVDSFFGAPTNFSASGGGQLQLVLDALTANNMLGSGATVTGNVVYVTGFVFEPTNNVGLTQITQQNPNCLMVAYGQLVLKTPGTLGTLTLSVRYVDTTGALVTKAVCGPLNIAGAAGDEVHGVFPFRQNGSAAIFIQCVGVTTPGALAYEISFQLRPAV
jgi:hypothetical protein